MPGLHHKPLAYGIRQPEIKKLSKRTGLKISTIEKIFTKLLKIVHALVAKDLRAWIKRYVPKMTGRLRFDLWSHVKDSRVRNNILRVFIHTDIDYAARVNAMKTANVRHIHVRKRYRGRIIILNDSAAIGSFFDKMVIYAIARIMHHIRQQKVYQAARTPLGVKDLNIIKLW